MRRSFGSSNAYLFAPIVAIATIVVLIGCQPHRVEYHRRPAFYERASTQKLEDEVVLDDGTVVRYRSAVTPGIVGWKGEDGSKPFKIREENEDGTVALNALLPEHVLSNALACVRNEEYQLMWDQLLAEQTRTAYANAGQGFPEFSEFFRKNRHELASTLTRMVAGLPSMEVSFTNMGDGVTRCALRPQVAAPFKFRIVDVAEEHKSFKLLMIR